MSDPERPKLSRGEFVQRALRTPRARWGAMALAIAVIVALAITLWTARRLIFIGLLIAVVIIAVNAAAEALNPGRKEAKAPRPPGLEWVAVGGGFMLAAALQWARTQELNWALLGIGGAGVLMGLFTMFRARPRGGGRNEQ